MPTRSELLLSPMPGEMLTKLLEAQLSPQKNEGIWHYINLKIPPALKFCDFFLNFI